MVRKGAITLPQRAIMTGPNGYYVYMVKPDNTVQRQNVTVDDMQEGISVVSKGLASGDKVVLDGQYRLTPNSRVKIDPTPAAAAAATEKTG